jgi:hypothetical protein
MQPESSVNHGKSCPEVTHPDLVTPEALWHRRRFAEMRSEAENLTAKLKNLVRVVSKDTGLPLLKTKRKQLKAINETINKLRHENVPVPDGLFMLGQSLADDIEKAVGDQVVLHFLKEELSQILATIENNDESKQ